MEGMWDEELAAAVARHTVDLEERGFYAAGTVGGNLGCSEPTTVCGGFSQVPTATLPETHHFH